MGRDQDEKRYQFALEACALQADLAQLPAGDLSEIGEKVGPDSVKQAMYPGPEWGSVC